MIVRIDRQSRRSERRVDYTLHALGRSRQTTRSKVNMSKKIGNICIGLRRKL